jgi:hypothetical protein
MPLPHLDALILSVRNAVESGIAPRNAPVGPSEGVSKRWNHGVRSVEGKAAAIVP